MKNLKKETTVLLIGIVSIVLLAGGLSLAYFLMRINGVPLPFSARTARTGTITIDGGTGFNSSPIIPGYIDTNDVTLTATASDTDMAANINLIYTNTMPDLQYKIEVKSISVNGSTVGFSEYVINDLSAESFTNVGTATEETTKTLATVKIKASEYPIVIVYTVTLTLPSSAGNTNQGGVFTARIGGASVDPSSIEDKYNFVEKLLADHSEMLTTTNTEDGSAVRYFNGTSANNFVAFGSNSVTKTVGSYEYYSSISCSADAYRGKTCSSFSGTVYSYQTTSKTYTKYKYCHYDSNMGTEVCEASPLYDSANECYEATAWEGTCIGDESTANTDSRVFASQYECDDATGWDGTCTRVDNSATTRYFTSLSQCQMYAGATSSTCAAIESSCSYVEYNNSSTCSYNSVEPCTAINEVCTKYDLREFTDKSECISHASMLTSSSDCHTVEEHNVTYDEYNFFRIIRTNTDLEGGGVRLIYAGSGSLSDLSSGQLLSNNISTFNGNFSDNYNNTTGLKNPINTWYSNNMSSLNNYINDKAIYCNDISHYEENYYGHYSYIAGTRISNNAPSLKCGVDENGNIYNASNAASSKYTKNALTGNGLLTYPVALISVDEVAMTNSNVSTSWLQEVTFSEEINNYGSYSEGTMTMTPMSGSSTDNNGINWYTVISSGLSSTYPSGQYKVVPVLSLKSNVYVLGGTGTKSNPYIVKTN